MKSPGKCLFVLLAIAPLTLNAQGAAAASFDVRNGYGLRQIRANATGENLLINGGGSTAGHYIIGSATGADNNQNVASFASRNSNGIMYPMVGPTVPNSKYSLQYGSPTNGVSRLPFTASVGPSNYAFAVMTLPCDGRRDKFTHFRWEGSPLYRYDQNPFAYNDGSGNPVYIRFASGNPKWGEMIGPKYTVRYTITSSSRSMKLAFVRHPNLDAGVHNVEFSFGALAKGQVASASGHIQVFNTDPSIFPSLVFEAETTSFHQIGRRDADGWSVNVNDTFNRFMTYGPYTTAVAPGSRTATYRLLLDNTTADNKHIVTLDVFDANSGRVIAARNVLRRDFTAGPMKYHDFNLGFTASSGQRLEFRVFYKGYSYVRHDKVIVR